MTKLKKSNNYLHSKPLIVTDLKPKISTRLKKLKPEQILKLKLSQNSNNFKLNWWQIQNTITMQILLKMIQGVFKTFFS